MTSRFVIATACLLAVGSGSASAIELGESSWREPVRANRIDADEAAVVRVADCRSARGVVAKRACETSALRQNVRAEAGYPLQRDPARMRELFRRALILGAFR